MTSTYNQWNVFSKALLKYQRQSLERIAEEGCIDGFDKDVCAALIEKLDAVRNDDVAHFKPPKKRKRKDPNAPKGPRNAYIFFSSDKDILEELQTKYPGTSRKDLTKHIGERWRGMTDDEKKPYHAQAASDKIRYGKEFTEFSETGSFSKEEEKPAQKKQKKAPAKKAPAKKVVKKKATKTKAK